MASRESRTMLTKSDLLSLLQCHRKLWLEHNRPELVQKEAFALNRRAMDGLVVGAASRTQLGADVVWPRSSFEEKDMAVQHAIDQLRSAPTKPAAEVPLVYRSLYARADALLPRGGAYVLQETKAATFPLKKDKTPDSPSEHHLNDVAIQQWVMEGCGLTAASVELNLLDSNWRYLGDSNYSGLFRKLDVTAESEERKSKVPTWLEQAEDTMKGAMPDATTGKHCEEPHDCPFRHFCESLEPPKPPHPLELLPDGAGKALAKKLFETKGFTSILEAAPEDLTGKNAKLYLRIQSAHRTGKAILDPAGASALKTLPYPRYFFDFEGIDFPVPQWKGFRPYEHAPFQWSCHIETSPGEFQHAEFLDLTGNDPSLTCIEEMRQVINPYDGGPIIVYNASYERSRLDDLAARHSEYAELMDRYIVRLFDLLPIVKDSFYHPDMHGSFSIKAVLPTVTPGMTYAHLDEVQDGSAAQLAYLVAVKDPRTSAKRKADIEANLRAYCRQDTWAMVELMYFLTGSARPKRPDMT